MTLDKALQNELTAQRIKEEQLYTVFTKKLETQNIAFAKAHKTFLEMEKQLDQLETEDKNENSRRRRINGLKSFEFQGVSNKATVEDLNQIYDGNNDSNNFGPGNFRKGDKVNCVVDRKKSTGTVIIVNQKGLVVVTKDRKKLRISWEDIEDDEVQITKLNSEYD